MTTRSYRRGRGLGRTCSTRCNVLPRAGRILLCSSLSLSREVCLEPLNPLEFAVLPERRAVKSLALLIGVRLYWGLSWARLLFLTSRPSGVYLQLVSRWLGAQAWIVDGKVRRHT